MRLTELLSGIEPGQQIINLSVGEPQHGVPSFTGPVLNAHIADFGRYPLVKGLSEFRAACAQWMGRRFNLPRALDPEREVLALNGSREGLFLAALAARQYVRPRANPAVLMPNPFYPAYGAGALAAGCETIHLPAIAAHGFLPDLDAISPADLQRCVAFYIASPANPQGSVADADYFARLHALALKHDFIVLSDECYSEIYTQRAPGSMLEASGPDFKHVAAFQSLSKRSNLPGLRVGFVAGDGAFLASYLELRNIAAPQVPVPAQHVAIAAYGDETHVEISRAAYIEKFAMADRKLGGRFGYRRPAGGFCLWLDVSDQGGDEIVTQQLWARGGLRVIPGSYLARMQANGSNPGAGYIRVALVQDIATTREAFERLVHVLESM